LHVTQLAVPSGIAGNNAVNVRYRAALRNLTLHVPSLESHGNRGFPLWPGACSAVRSFEDAERERVSMLMPLPPKR